MKILSQQDFKTTKWSGGETTELFIYPEDANFASRDFQFRLSTATVEVEESTFTPLDDVSRTLVLLEGEMKLIHEEHHSKLLLPFDQDSFDGGWNTKSIGKCIDFNLMTKGGCKGSIEVMRNSFHIDNHQNQWTTIYCIKGDVNDNVSVGQLLVTHPNEKMNANLSKEAIVLKVTLQTS